MTTTLTKHIILFVPTYKSGLKWLKTFRVLPFVPILVGSMTALKNSLKMIGGKPVDMMPDEACYVLIVSANLCVGWKLKGNAHVLFAGDWDFKDGDLNCRAKGCVGLLNSYVAKVPLKPLPTEKVWAGLNYEERLRIAKGEPPKVTKRMRGVLRHVKKHKVINWPGVRGRTGGAFRRMVERMKDSGLMYTKDGKHWSLTGTGIAAIAEKK